MVTGSVIAAAPWGHCRRVQQSSSLLGHRGLHQAPRVPTLRLGADDLNHPRAAFPALYLRIVDSHLCPRGTFDGANIGASLANDHPRQRSVDWERHHHVTRGKWLGQLRVGIVGAVPRVLLMAVMSSPVKPAATAISVSAASPPLPLLLGLGMVPALPPAMLLVASAPPLVLLTLSLRGEVARRDIRRVNEEQRVLRCCRWVCAIVKGVAEGCKRS